MCDQKAISACILKIVEKDPFLRLEMRAKEDFNRHQFFFPQISNAYRLTWSETKHRNFFHRYLIEFYETNRMSHVPHLYDIIILLK